MPKPLVLIGMPLFAQRICELSQRNSEYNA